MFLLIYVSVLFFGVEAHIKFTECQAEFYRSQPGNEDVVFETDGIPCQAEARALYAYNSRWNNIVKDGNLQQKKQYDIKIFKNFSANFL